MCVWLAGRATRDTDSPTAGSAREGQEEARPLLNTDHLIVLDPGDRKANAIP
jgi:hypothetical protein